MKLKSLPNFPKPKVKDSDYGRYTRDFGMIRKFAERDGIVDGYNACLSEVGELDIPVPSELIKSFSDDNFAKEPILEKERQAFYKLWADYHRKFSIPYSYNELDRIFNSIVEIFREDKNG